MRMDVRNSKQLRVFKTICCDTIWVDFTMLKTAFFILTKESGPEVRGDVAELIPVEPDI